MTTPVEYLTAQIELAGLGAPVLGLLAGAALTLTPISWPSIPAVVALVGPARAAAREARPAAVSGKRGFAVVLGFAIGMDGVTGPFVSLLVVAAFVLGRAATLYAAAAAGGRWLTPDDPAKARRVDVAIAVVLLLSAAYYAWRLLDGQVLTILPGEAGLLP